MSWRTRALKIDHHNDKVITTSTTSYCNSIDDAFKAINNFKI